MRRFFTSRSQICRVLNDRVWSSNSPSDVTYLQIAEMSFLIWFGQQWDHINLFALFFCTLFFYIFVIFIQKLGSSSRLWNEVIPVGIFCEATDSSRQSSYI